MTRGAGALVREWDAADRRVIARAVELIDAGDVDGAIAALRELRHACAYTVEAERVAWGGFPADARACLVIALDSRVKDRERDARVRCEQPRLFVPVAPMAGQTDLFNPDQEVT